jgi:hypothetical protein
VPDLGKIRFEERQAIIFHKKKTPASRIMVDVDNTHARAKVVASPSAQWVAHRKQLTEVPRLRCLYFLTNSQHRITFPRIMLVDVIKRFFRRFFARADTPAIDRVGGVDRRRQGHGRTRLVAGAIDLRPALDVVQHCTAIVVVVGVGVDRRAVDTDDAGAVIVVGDVRRARRRQSTRAADHLRRTGAGYTEYSDSGWIFDLLTNFDFRFSECCVEFESDCGVCRFMSRGNGGCAM